MTEIEMESTMVLSGVWYEVEVTQCYTYMILRDRWGTEYKFYNDEEGVAEMHATLGWQ